MGFRFCFELFVFGVFLNLQQKTLFTVNYLDEIPPLPLSSRVYSIEFVVQIFALFNQYIESYYQRIIATAYVYEIDSLTILPWLSAHNSLQDYYRWPKYIHHMIAHNWKIYMLQGKKPSVRNLLPYLYTNYIIILLLTVSIQRGVNEYTIRPD